MQADRYTNAICVSMNTFSIYVNHLLNDCGLTPKKFAELIQVELNKLLVDDKIPLERSRNIGVSEQVVATILVGSSQPSYEQVMLIILAFITWYNSAFLARVCRENNRDLPIFSDDDASYLLWSAGYAAPANIEKARKVIEQRFNGVVPLKKISLKLDGGSGSVKGKRKRKEIIDEPRTDGDIQAMPIDNYRITS